MGAVSWIYFVPYQDDFQKALDDLRTREFAARRYHAAGPPKHATIEDAINDAGADGTRSILDIGQIGNEIEFCEACVLSEATLDELFETPHPTHQDVVREGSMYGLIDRGQAVCFPVYNQSGTPAEICFAGYSFD